MLPVDAAARERIETDTGATLFVEAGAGSGKTYASVRRICRLVLHDGVELNHIAAITFTEKAAAELRERVRVELARTPQSAVRDAALVQVDTAAIGTLHAFAARIVSEYPIEAGVPPRISVVDAMGSQLSFERRWRRIRAALFTDAAHAPRQLPEATRIVVSAGASLDQIRALADSLDRNWDRLRVNESAPMLRGADLPSVLAMADGIVDVARECLDPDDRLLGVLAKIRLWRGELAEAASSDLWLNVVDSCPGPGNGGKGANWTGGPPLVAAIKQQIKELKARATEVRDAYVGAAVAVVVHHMSRVVCEEAAERRRCGELEFHDLLVYARNVLTVPEVAAAVHNSYRRILLDEFQDTDPLQLEIAERIVAGSPGRLFTVGDPKQSIYRFRRADIAAYMGARDEASDIVTLTTNFRSTRPVLDWVNAVFGRLVQADHHIQPAYTPLDPAPGRPEWRAEWGPRPFVFSADEPVDGEEALSPTDATRAREARDVARIIATALTDGWNKEVGGDGSYTHHPVSLRDMCILIPSRAVLPFLERALDEAGIEFRSEASSLVYSTQEVHDLLVTCRALANVADEGALVACLRTPLFACGDDDLLVWKTAGGRWSLFAGAPVGLETSPVAASLAYLKSVWHRLGEFDPGKLLSTLATERRVFEVSMDSPRHRDVWRRLRFVIDQAHAWYGEDRGDLRDYLDWASMQEEENARVAEAVLPEIGVNAVRIMTIHSAKGLQFPMVIVAGMSTGFRNTLDPALWDDDGTLHVNLARGVRSSGLHAAATAAKAHQRAERIRLLYVACTRAESVLAVSGYQARTDGWGALVAEGVAGSASDQPELRVAERRDDPAARSATPLLSWADWLAETDTVRANAVVPDSFSATTVAHGGAAAVLEGYANAAALTQPEWIEVVEGAAGATDHGDRLGTALHAVLQESRLLTTGFDDIARSIAVAEELRDVERFVALARSAVEAEPVRRAAAREFWQELPLAGRSPDGSALVEGIADLVYREDDGSLVVVDYKTDVGVSGETLEQYWIQVAIYADLLRREAGERVGALVLVFCRPGTACVLERRF